jgi:sorting nexin-8
MQRDLYIAVRDLFGRHDRFSPDAAERLRKRVETQSLKLEAIKVAQKDGWEVESDKLSVSIEKDRAAIATCMARRSFIRHWWVYFLFYIYIYI